jgi:hypothetical protein
MYLDIDKSTGYTANTPRLRQRQSTRYLKMSLTCLCGVRCGSDRCIMSATSPERALDSLFGSLSDPKILQRLDFILILKEEKGDDVEGKGKLLKFHLPSFISSYHYLLLSIFLSINSILTLLDRIAPRSAVPTLHDVQTTVLSQLQLQPS